MGYVEHAFDWNLTPRLSQEVVDRQDVGLVSSSEQVFVVAFLGGLAILALHLLPILDSLGLIRPRLQDDPKCGLTTGGQVCVKKSFISSGSCSSATGQCVEARMLLSGKPNNK